MRVKLDCGKVMVEEGGAWDAEWREAHPHEAMPALIEIVCELQRRILEMERWRNRMTE